MTIKDGLLSRILKTSSFNIQVKNMYFNYHATAKKLIIEGKLLDYYFTQKHNSIAPALVLIFSDEKHPIMPIREERWEEYISLIAKSSVRKQEQILRLQSYSPCFRSPMFELLHAIWWSRTKKYFSFLSYIVVGISQKLKTFRIPFPRTRLQASSNGIIILLLKNRHKEQEARRNVTEYNKIDSSF